MDFKIGKQRIRINFGDPLIGEPKKGEKIVKMYFVMDGGKQVSDYPYPVTEEEKNKLSAYFWATKRRFSFSSVKVPESQYAEYQRLKKRNLEQQSNDLKKKPKFTTRVPLYDKEGFEFTAQADKNNSLEKKDIINELKPYIERYKPDKNIHYHLYQWDKGGAYDTLFFGATRKHGTFVCIYCEMSGKPHHIVVIDGIRMLDYRQVISDPTRSKKVYI